MSGTTEPTKLWGVGNEEEYNSHVRAIKDQLSRKHQHQYTIPVEWKSRYQQELLDNIVTIESAMLYVLSRPIDVTRLRCTCGAETDR